MLKTKFDQPSAAMQNLSVLIVDDNPEFHYDVGRRLRHFCSLSKASNSKEMRQKLAGDEHFDIILLDLALDETKKPIGLDLIPEIRKARKEAAIVVATQYFNEPEHSINAMRLGARDFIDKNTITPEELITKIIKAVEDQAVANSSPIEEFPDDESESSHPFIGQSPKIQELKKILARIGQMPKIAVFITGETGTGKEIAARYLHRHSPRANKPFIGVNLSATPENLVESALFGHVKGAFTDAKGDNAGFFREANGGVLLLDEIGDISLPIQIKLLRAIEERVIRPVGSDKDVHVDVHLLTATHKKLAGEVVRGNFRADLYQRLKTLAIEIPPLRDRPEDLPLLLQYYLRLQDTTLRVPAFFTRDVLDRFKQYPWPGNIRELRAAVDHCFVWSQILGKTMADHDCLPEEIRDFDPNKTVIMPATSPAIHLRDIGTPILPDQPQTSLSQPTFASRKEASVYKELADVEYAMRLYNKVKTDVAKHLDYKSTDSLLYKMKVYYKQYPHLFAQFPLIRQEYRLQPAEE